jgi:uncharacterized membrane protein
MLLLLLRRLRGLHIQTPQHHQQYCPVAGGLWGWVLGVLSVSPLAGLRVALGSLLGLLIQSCLRDCLQGSNVQTC